MKNTLTLLLVLTSMQFFAQKDSLQLGDKYWEDQLYISVTYNTFNNQPNGAGGTGFSYGLSVGYIKDFPLNKKGNWSSGIGVGYNFDSFNHDLLIDGNGNLTVDASVLSNKIKLHNIEFPIQLRWRTSDAVTYSFWRIYAGLKLSYNLSNSFNYMLKSQKYTFTDVSTYNKFQTGVEASVGYGAFNFFVYYGLTPIYKNSVIANKKVNTSIAKFGLIFYLL